VLNCGVTQAEDPGRRVSALRNTGTDGLHTPGVQSGDQASYQEKR